MKRQEAINLILALAAKTIDPLNREALQFAAIVLSSGQEPKPKLTHEVKAGATAYRAANKAQAEALAVALGVDVTEVKEPRA